MTEENKKTLFINGTEVEFDKEPNLLEVMRKNGFNVPTLCYRPDLTQFGACRMCVVEIEGRGIQSSCTMPPENGLKIHTNSEKVRKIRKMVLELLLANHNVECPTCYRAGNCELKKYAEEYGVDKIRFPRTVKDVPVDCSSPSIYRDPSKCILCGACVRACSEFQGHGVLGFANRGSKTLVQPIDGAKLKDVDCVNCGQCAAVCPTGAISIIDDRQRVWNAINNENKKVVVQIAPAPRVALGEAFGLEPGANSIKLINSALRAIGFDLVFDTNFSADLTIMEEGTEFLNRLKENKNLPLFTSCCPAWVKYLESTHPELLNHLSTAKSPMSMFSPVLKEFLPKYYEGYKREDIVSVAIMPCTAKKYEAKRPELSKNGVQDTDIVLTTQELVKMIKEAGIDFKKLKPSEADNPFGEYTGAGTIFGASGGVAEAAVRSAYALLTGQELSSPDIQYLRGVQNRSREIALSIKGTKVVIRVVSTLKQAEKALQEVIQGTNKFQMLEVMACPGGCVNGGGQPKSCDDTKVKVKRAIGLYKDDLTLPVRKSHLNTDIQKLYKEHLEAPNSHLAHEMLHTTYNDKLKGSYKDFN